MGKTILEMIDIKKSFSGIYALSGINFSLEMGEVHALLGENGAGKSTLIKVLGGIYKPDSGTIKINGQEVEINGVSDAQEKGIGIIHQEIVLVPYLTVAQNLFLGREIKTKFGTVDMRETNRRAGEMLANLGVNIHPDTLVESLTIAQQQMVEICKALMVDAKVLIMDEPTAALTERETETLFKVMKSLREKGVSIVYISHRMEEIFELCDRITILRDGTYIGTEEISKIDMDGVVRMMIGREIGERFPKRDAKIGDVVLKVEGLTKEKLFHDVSFEVRAGEVLGVAGLMGAGRTEIMRALFGCIARDRGSIYIDGEKVKIKNPEQAIKAGIGFITEDRKTEGLLLEKSIADNIEIVNLKAVSQKGVLSKRKEKDLVYKEIEEFRIKCFGPWHECDNLSGGNQQKVVLAKWIATNPKILILDEPTRGVDIGAKKEIYHVINQMASLGVAVIMVSSELPEVLGMSDRIMVVREGEVRGILDGKEADQEKIMTLATGGTL